MKSFEVGQFELVLVATLAGEFRSLVQGCSLVRLKYCEFFGEAKVAVSAPACVGGCSFHDAPCDLWLVAFVSGVPNSLRQFGGIDFVTLSEGMAVIVEARLEISPATAIVVLGVVVG